jgi:hypothetical protein
MLHKKYFFNFAISSAFKTQGRQTNCVLNKRFPFHFQNTLLAHYSLECKAVQFFAYSLKMQSTIN